MKKVIINADDFGYSANKNEAIKLGVQSGVITASSIITNMEGFNQAVLEILPEIPFVDLGFHFNIMEGKSLTNPSLLTDNRGFFNRSYLYLILNSNSKMLQKQIEIEFKTQIERILKYKHISHIDSHVHTHAIPAIFNIVKNLAVEYNIPFIRTQHEIPYKVPNTPISKSYCINTVKNILLNSFTYINKKNINNISTNDYFIGVLYTGGMTKQTVIEGLKKIPDENSLTEIIIHPSIKLDKKKDREFEITQDTNFMLELEQLECILASFSEV